MWRIRSGAALAAACLIACSNAPSASTPGAGATPQAIDLTSTKAADLRTRLDLLFGEQVFIVAKESAAAANLTDAYPGYVALLGANRNDLGVVVGRAFGNTSAAQFDLSWAQMNRDLVEYAVGLVTHKQSQADMSSADIVNVVGPALSLLVSRLTLLPATQINQLVMQQVLGMRTVVDDTVGQNFPKLYTDLHAAYAQTPRLGDLLAAQIAKLFSDKFPGDPTLKAVTLRVSLNHLLQEHAYLATMATNAAIAGRHSEAAAARAALDANAAELGSAFTDVFGTTTSKQLAELWAARDSSLLDYSAGSPTAKQTLTQDFVAGFSALSHVAPALLGDQAASALAVIDDQRTKAFATLAIDDRAAAAELEPVADGIASRGSTQS